MRKLQYIILIIVMLLTIKNIQAQIPINDPAWIIDTTHSDDFSGTKIKNYKWSVEDSVYDGHGLEMMFKRNVTVSSGTVKIKVDTLNPNRTYSSTTYSYQSGSFNSKDTSFKYGYLEISAKYPIGNAHYWPAFWVWMGSCGTSHWYNEIDIAENGDGESLNGHEMGTNLHVSNPGSCGLDINIYYGVTNLPRVDSIFHKYALQWDPNNIYWYFDDNLVRSFHDNDGDSIPQHHLQLVFDMYVPDWLSNSVLHTHMPPANYEIEYFNYYKLNSYCSNALTICNPSTDYYAVTPASQSRAIEKSITTGGSCSPTFSTDDNCTLRATDYILLDVGTTINQGTLTTGQFSIIVEPCQQ